MVAGAAIFWARSVKVTPESLTKYMETHPLDGQAPGDRAKRIETVADQLNALTYEERRDLRSSRRIDGFFKSLSHDEQARFLDRTLPTGFKQMMDSLNKMEPAKRKVFVERALRDMKEREGERPPDAEVDQNARKIIDQGFKSFYSEASAEVKMDVAPLIEQLQKNLQGFR
jgi:preprotein translocase subunit SecA